MSSGRRTILLITAIAAVAVIVAAIALSFSGNPEKVYRECMERAELAFANQDYDTAVFEYRKAIDAKDTSVAAYQGLSEVYIAMGDLDNARSTLEEGISKTGSKWLEQLLAELEQPDDIQTDLAQGEVSESEAAINSRLLKRIGGASYRDYNRTALPDSSELQADGSIYVRFSEIPGTMVFRNSAQQADAVNGTTVAEGALPEEVILDDINYLVGKTPVTKEELTGLRLTSLQQTTDALGADIVRFTAWGCTVTVACDKNGTIQPGARTTIVPTDALARASDGRGELTVVTGVIIDAQTGEPVEDITLRFFEDEDTSGEPLVEPVVTDSMGEYEVGLPPGTYYVEMSGDGYITTTKEITIGEYEVEAGGDYTVTKDLAEGEARIVLEWGDQPQDLDAYLFVDTDSGEHMRLSRWEGSISGDGISAELDIDDRDGNGPETITIHGFAGVMTFDVADYLRTGTMAQNGATVTIYMSGESPVTVTLDSGSGVEDAWQVCTIDHGVLKIDNCPSDKGWGGAAK